METYATADYKLVVAMFLDQCTGPEDNSAIQCVVRSRVGRAFFRSYRQKEIECKERSDSSDKLSTQQKLSSRGQGKSKSNQVLNSIFCDKNLNSISLFNC